MSDFKNGIKENLKPESVFTVKQIKARAKLDQNEFPFDIPDYLKERILELLKVYPWNRYPSPELYRETKIKFSEHFPDYVTPDHTILATGADELILASMLVTRETVQIFEPTYPIYQQMALLTGKNIISTNLNDEFSLTPDMIDTRAHCVCLVSPNTPAGQTLPPELIEYACTTVPIVVVDEAYYDFSRKTVLPLIQSYSNLFVFRSFSKAMGAAGVRLGYGFACPELIQYLEKSLFVPYNMNIFTLFMSWYFRELTEWQEDLISIILSEREKIRHVLRELNLNPLPSEGNFIAFRGDRDLFENLAQYGVRIRNIGHLPKLSGYLRVTIGSPEENNIFIDSLKQCIREKGGTL